MALSLLGLDVGLFPRGVTHYVVGGLLIGLGAGTVYLGTAIPPGNSTFLESSLSYVSDLSRLDRDRFRRSRDWRLLLAVSMVAGAAIYAVGWGGAIWVTDLSWWRLLAGGILVGVGTRIGKGCTMGHGVCGIGSGSRVSIVNAITFVTIGVATALTVNALGVV